MPAATSAAPGRGSFVRENGAVGESRRAATDVATSAIGDAVREGRSLGVTLNEVRAIVAESIARWYPEEEQK